MLSKVLRRRETNVMVRSTTRYFATAEKLRGTRSVVLEKRTERDVLSPKRDPVMGFLVGSSDRGSGLHFADMVGFSDGEETGFLGDGIVILKVQAPLDNSSDSAGGIGRMTPATLLVKNKEASYVRLVSEDAPGHNTLLRLVLRSKNQVAYLYGEEINRGFWGVSYDSEVHIYSEELPTSCDDIGW